MTNITPIGMPLGFQVFFSQFKIYYIPFCFSKNAIKENILHGCGNDITGTCLLTLDYLKFW